MNGGKPRILSFVEGRDSAVKSPIFDSQKSLKFLVASARARSNPNHEHGPRFSLDGSASSAGKQID